MLTVRGILSKLQSSLAFDRDDHEQVKCLITDKMFYRPLWKIYPDLRPDQKIFDLLTEKHMIEMDKILQQTNPFQACNT